METKSVSAVILAAGRGTRMGKITETLPKPLVPVAGRPAVCHVVDGLAGSGIRDFILVTGYLSSMVRETMADYRRDELKIDFVEQEQQLGTAHAMGLTRRLAGGNAVVLAFADIITSPENYGAMLDRFVTNHCDLVGGVRHVDDPWRAAAVYVDGDFNIERIVEKPPIGTSTTPWAHAGMYCFADKVYDYIEKIKPSQRGEYEITDAVTMMINDGLKCQAQELVGYWKDLATPENVVEAETMIAAACTEIS